MPGLNLIAHYSSARSAHDRARRLLARQRRPRNHSVETLLESDLGSLTASIYEGYPLDSWENDEYRFFFEGYLYGKNRDSTRKELARVARTAFSDTPAGLENWLVETDGEFVLALEHKMTGDWRVLNDVFGRLPVYLHVSDLGIVASRDIRFTVTATERVQTNPLALAQYFMFGSCLGDLTPWKDVSYLPSATLLSFSRFEGFKLQRLHRLDVSEKSSVGDIDRNVEVLSDLFLQGCRDRAAIAKTCVVALSGGFDSRAVAAGLAKEHIPFQSITMSRPGWYPDSECHIARETASLLGSDWREFAVPPCDGRSYLELLNLKSGLNELGMSFHVAFFREIQKTYGPGAVYFTGEGGDKTLPDLRPYTSFHDDRETAQYAIDRRAIFGLDDAASMAGISPERLFGSILHQVSTYPGRTGVDKYIHFLIYERSLKWLFEGEDRNRAYFWTTTPFYSVPFYNAAMKCPDEQKHGYGLYFKFLSRLNRQVASLKKAGFAGEPGSLMFDARHFGKLLLHSTPRFSRRMQHLIKGVNGFSSNSEIVQLVRHQLDHCAGIERGLDVAVVRRILDEAESHPKRRITNLATVTSMLESFNGGSSLGDWSGTSLP